MLRFLKAALNAVRSAIDSAFGAVVDCLYPGLRESAVAGAAAAEQEVTYDPWEGAADANAEREVAFNDARTWANLKLAGEAGLVPDTVPPRMGWWLNSLSDAQLEQFADMPEVVAYGHVCLGIDAPGLPNVLATPFPMPGPAPRSLQRQPEFTPGEPGLHPLPSF